MSIDAKDKSMCTISAGICAALKLTAAITVASPVPPPATSMRNGRLNLLKSGALLRGVLQPRAWRPNRLHMAPRAPHQQGRGVDRASPHTFPTPPLLLHAHHIAAQLAAARPTQATRLQL
eukprot:CAMPEP_0172769574 /NCGR_PEP_ID=MMETSP1074-20121228/186890_1 /TAXON_ID=2916 /ORGANISM="Ceratium fusus, Strain PA161109" /LENGTH=119 /DNA_ID=CAMNT_0013605177 /DNA_START=1155 /DNA_END=1515 /DNA_ORIENTATION=+